MDTPGASRAQQIRIRPPGPGLLAIAFLLPFAHPTLLPFVGAPSHLLWWLHVLPVAFITYRKGEMGAWIVVPASAAMLVAGERLFGLGYGQPAGWQTVIALAVALTFTNLLVAGFGLFARRGESRLLHQASHDALTGLPNRAYLVELLEHAVAMARRRPGDYRFAVMFLDIDQFKRVNDSLGHVAGDRLLTDVGRRLKLAVREVDTVARLGGDEFGILLDDLADLHDALRAADRIREMLNQPFHVGRQEIVISASMGIATSTADYDRAEDMLRDADTAMYRAKSAGRRRAEVFDVEMHREAVAQLEMETELRRAIESDQLSAAYQPLVRLSDGTVTGFEVLLRWQHPELGAVPPMRFVAVAEETGLIGALGDWVLDEVCRTACGWRDRGILPADIRLHINLSPRQLQQPTIVEGIREALHRYALPGTMFGLEITETAVMADPHASAIKLRMLKDMGLRLSVDDFGTGYSSLGYLQRFPIDVLKIDRSFIAGIGDAGKNTEIVRAVAALGRELHLDVVAEGVETAAQARIMTALGCDLAQGYYFARPMPRHRATALLARKARNDARANLSRHPADEAYAVR